MHTPPKEMEKYVGQQEVYFQSNLCKSIIPLNDLYFLMWQLFCDHFPYPANLLDIGPGMQIIKSVP